MTHAIPTRYKDVLFRSRLEARWAAFFDLLGWPYEYEPIDLKGYIPDFILKFHEPLLVEVKPELYLKDLEQHTPKINLSGWGHEALIVGASLFTLPDWPAYGSIGLLGELPCDGTKGRWWYESLLIECERGHLSFNTWEGSYMCRVCGLYRGDNHFRWLKGDKPGRLWAEAGNKTRWHPDKGKENSDGLANQEPAAKDSFNSTKPNL